MMNYRYMQMEHGVLMIDMTCHASSKKAWRLIVDDPPLLKAFLANSFHFLAFLLISSSSITISTHLLISFLSTIPSPSLLFTLTPVFQTSSIIFALVAWSDHCENATVGTPAANASTVEFHPQCVKKHPIAWWFNTST
ncbi:hypothetical protein HanIR_Chr14g0689571 [Helianthus annuus]|nr:hypothetical protein HanIR_Chr14g0689571 [Helianthus annuus]